MDNEKKDLELIEEISKGNGVNYTRKVMELRSDLDNMLNSVVEWYGKQVELDKNNDDQLVALDKLQKTEYEYNEKRAKIIKEYLDKVSKLIPDRLDDKSLHVYYKARYVGPVKNIIN